MPGPSKEVCYRFGEFTLAPRRRVILRNGAPVPLIPKYFDLLCLLVERRADALDRQEIFDRIWPDVVVSDSALTQAIRTLRRTLDDSPRTPRYIRTVSRHGYQFVFEPVVAGDDVPIAPDPLPPAPSPPPQSDETRNEVLVARLLGSETYGDLFSDERREAAEQLHALGTEDALRRIAGRPGSAHARALLRDSRWDVPDAGAVPILGAPSAVHTIAALVGLRLRGAARAAAERLGAAAGAGAAAGIVGGVIGGLVLLLPADSAVTSSTVTGLAIIGGVAGLFGAAFIGAGLAAAEVLARSRRRTALAVCGALSGVVAGLLARMAVTAVFSSVIGRSPGLLGGPLEGGIVGCAAGLGYAWSTHTPWGGGMAAPRGAARWTVGVVTALCCAAAAAVLGGIGASTVSVTLDTLSLTYDGSQVGLAPLARAMGEPHLRPMTRAVASGFEGLLFGFGLAFGLTHRPFRPFSR